MAPWVGETGHKSPLRVAWRESDRPRATPHSYAAPPLWRRYFADVKTERKPWWVVSGVFVLLALWAVKHAFFPTPEPPRLLTAPVSVADVEQTVLASGIIQPAKLVSVGAQASGRIVAMHVALGDPVNKGQLIAEIDPSTQRNALQNAEAVLAQDRAQRASRAAALRQADLVFKRAAATYAQRLTSRADYDAAEAAFDGAQADVVALDAQIRAAQIAVNLARVSLGYTNVIAPMAGTVVAIVAPEGQTVNAVQAAPTIVKLADLETMTVKAQISEADVPHVHAGQSLYFTILADPSHRYYAKLRAVEPAPESIAVDTATSPAATTNTTTASSAVYYNGLFDIPNPNHELQPSMTAQVNIVLGEARGALSIPTSALGETDAQGRRLVRVVDGKRNVESRWVRVGLNNSAIVQVLDGLRSGDTVVLGDSTTLDAAAAKHPAGTT
jgi:macrolide-specific efflux system membrane fusion protein